MNFETAYLTALDGLIVAMGGTVPTVATLNFRMAELARLEAIVAAADATLPLTGINYQDAILSHWAAAIAALGGAVPPPQQNYRQALLLHVQALQAARGVTAQLAGNFEDAMLGLLGATGGGIVYHPLAASWFTAVEANGENFGPSAGAIATNKGVWNDIILGLEAIASLIAGQNCLQQLTRTGEGSIIALAGVSAPTVAIFGPNPTYTGFVPATDFNPMSGLKGGAGRILVTGRNWDGLPQNDSSGLVVITEAPEGDGTNRLIGGSGTSFTAGIIGDGRVRLGGGLQHTIAATAAAVPRFISMSRHQASTLLAVNNENTYSFSDTSLALPSESIIFLNSSNNLRPSTARLIFGAVGRSINGPLIRDLILANIGRFAWS